MSPDGRATWRSLYERGDNPLEGLDDDKVAALANAFVDAHNLPPEAIALLGPGTWAHEFRHDPEVADWIRSLLPAHLVACAEIWLDIDRRPVAIETETGFHICAHCGRTGRGKFLIFVDRSGVFPGVHDVTISATCVRAGLK